MTTEVYDIFEEDFEEDYTPLEIFQQHQKFSDVLTNNFLYAASVYFASREVTKENLRAFISDVIRLDKNLGYESGPKFNSPENVSLDPTPQRLNLAVPSLEIVKRLLYQLQLYLTKHPDKFTEYKDMVFIPDYYNSPYDFNSYPKEYFLFSAASVRDYMYQDKLLKDRYVVPYVEPGKVEPYFFKNNLLGGRLYLAQNVPSYDHANYVMYSWRFMHRNPEVYQGDQGDQGDQGADSLLDIPKVPQISFEVYKYVNPDQIELIRPDGLRKDKVLAYKVDDKVRYTVLLIE